MIDCENPAPAGRWNHRQQWVLSTTTTHPALITETDFIATQANHCPGYRYRHGTTSSQQRGPEHPKNLYLREDRL